MNKRPGVVGALAAAVLLTAVLGGCSDNGGGSLPSKSKPASPGESSKSPQQGGAAQVSLNSSDLGKILTDDKGRTLYLFEADKSGTSACYGGCAEAWPPLISSAKPKAGSGVKADLLSTTTRKDGKKQVVYGDHPLYYFQGDTKSGDTNGQGLDQFGAKWYVLDASGKEIKDKGSGGQNRSQSPRSGY